jgi:NADH-quinone oxidoreductase subunit M
MEMFAHGLTSASLFMMAGFIYNRLHSFNMQALRGSIRFMPVFAVLTAITGFSSMGLPGGSSFWGKFLTIMGAKEYALQLALLVLAGAFFSVLYVLYLLKTLYLDVKEEGRLVHLRMSGGLSWLPSCWWWYPCLWWGFYLSSSLPSLTPTLTFFLGWY